MFRTPHPTKIIRIVEEADKVKTFYLKNKRIATRSKPGQFVLVFVPFPADMLSAKTTDINLRDFEKLDQIPMSISFTNPVTETFGITVKEIGDTTSELHKYPVGQYLGIIGPLGRSFRGKAASCILVGGGIGVAPLRFLAHELVKKKRRITTIMGFRTKKEMLFVDEMKEISDNLIVTTDDGSYGEKAFATSAFNKYLEGNLTSEGNAEIMVYSCGPEFMIKGVLDTCRRFKLPVEVSLERYMHCGIGICGFCTINGLRVCKDGPVFSGKQLRDVKDLGKFRKTSSGKNEAF